MPRRMAIYEVGLLLASKPKREQGAETGGRDKGQRKISIFTSSAKLDGNFLGQILFIFCRHLLSIL